MKNYITTGTIINHTLTNGKIQSDRVIRTEADNYIIKVLTIGGTYREKSIHISKIVSYTNQVIC